MNMGARGDGRRAPAVAVCHHGHENDVVVTENLFEFFAARGIAHRFLNLAKPTDRGALHRRLAEKAPTVLLGFNHQIDQGQFGNLPILTIAARHGAKVLQWMFDHPAERWADFNHSDASTSRFIFHSPFSQGYFADYCCAGAQSATAGSIGPNRRSRSHENGTAAFAARPIACLIPLTLARHGKMPSDTEAEIGSLPPRWARAVLTAIERARCDLDRRLDCHLSEACAEQGLALERGDFHRCFRLVLQSVHDFRRRYIFRIASRFPVSIQSDRSAGPLLTSGRADFRPGVGAIETLERMPRCRAVVSVSPVNDSIHDRTCNALNAGCLPILEDNRAHRRHFVNGENALLFRYDDDSLAECLSRACGSVSAIVPLAERARVLRDQPPFRFGAFDNILALGDIRPAGCVSSQSGS